jgi:hypothetical protein
MCLQRPREHSCCLWHRCDDRERQEIQPCRTGSWRRGKSRTAWNPQFAQNLYQETSGPRVNVTEIFARDFESQLEKRGLRRADYAEKGAEHMRGLEQRDPFFPECCSTRSKRPAAFLFEKHKGEWQLLRAYRAALDGTEGFLSELIRRAEIKRDLTSRDSACPTLSGLASPCSRVLLAICQGENRECRRRI